MFEFSQKKEHINYYLIQRTELVAFVAGINVGTFWPHKAKYKNPYSFTIIKGTEQHIHAFFVTTKKKLCSPCKISYEQFLLARQSLINYNPRLEFPAMVTSHTFCSKLTVMAMYTYIHIVICLNEQRRPHSVNRMHRVQCFPSIPFMLACYGGFELNLKLNLTEFTGSRRQKQIAFRIHETLIATSESKAVSFTWRRCIATGVCCIYCMVMVYQHVRM